MAFLSASRPESPAANSEREGPGNPSGMAAHKFSGGEVIENGEETSQPAHDPKTPQPGSSCFALLSAVTKLAIWGDFVTEKLDSGFFADVYKVTNRSNDDVMVVKIGKSKSRADQIKLVKELELMNKLDHPNVLRSLGACIKEGQLHPMLEYISGGCLQDLLLNQENALPWVDRVNFARDIAAGMEYLHQRNIYHRDLTSRNCLVRVSSSNRRQVVVADFGLARVVHAEPNVPLDSPRKMSVVGSAFWMAPEMMRGEVYNKKVDVFSYGITLCEIIARIHADPDDIPRTNSFGLDVKHFRRKCEDCPPEFLQLAERCCDLNPSVRPWFKDIAALTTGIIAVCESAPNDGKDTAIMQSDDFTAAKTTTATASTEGVGAGREALMTSDRANNNDECANSCDDSSLQNEQEFDMTVAKTIRKRSSVSQQPLPVINETEPSPAS